MAVKIVEESYEVHSGCLARQMEYDEDEDQQVAGLRIRSRNKIRRIFRLKSCRLICSDKFSLMYNMSRKNLFELIYISSALLVSVIILPIMSTTAINETMSTTTTPNSPSTDSFNITEPPPPLTTTTTTTTTTPKSPHLSDVGEEANLKLAEKAKSNETSKDPKQVVSKNSAPLVDGMDQNRDESVLHTITVNSTSLFPNGQFQTNLSRENDAFSQRSTRELTGGEKSNFKKRRFFRMNNLNQNEDNNVRKSSLKRRSNNKGIKKKETGGKSNIDGQQIKSSEKSTKRPEMTHKSDKFLKFLKQIKNKKRLDQPALATNLNSSASFIHEDWINYGASQPASEKVTANGANEGFESSIEGDAGKPQAAVKAKNSAASNKGGGAVVAVKGNAAARTGNPPVAAAGGAPPKGRVVVRKESSSKENGRPVVTKTSTTTTTVGDGKKEAKVVSKSAALPAGLRQRIIEQFVKNGGDPQNIVVSDSTITTTSQSKKKTITTVYKIVPNKSPFNQTTFGQAKIIKPIMMTANPGDMIGANELISGDPKMFNIMHGNSDDQSAFKGMMGGANLRQGGGKKPQKLKKIMVTRTEVPQTLFMPSTGDSGGKLGEELGEFYQGPHETMFGLIERPGEFNSDQKRNIMNLDKMAEDNFESMKPHKMKHLDEESGGDFGGGGSQVKGVGGGGVSLEALIDAIKPSLQLELQTVSAKGGGDGKFLSHNDELISSLTAHDGVHHQDIAGKGYQQPVNKLLSNFHDLNLKSSPGAGSKSSTGPSTPNSGRPKKAEQQVVTSVSTKPTRKGNTPGDSNQVNPAGNEQVLPGKQQRTRGDENKMSQERTKSEQSTTSRDDDEGSDANDLEKADGQQKQAAAAEQQQQQQQQDSNGSDAGAPEEGDNESDNNVEVQRAGRKRKSESERRETRKEADEKPQSMDELRRVISAGSQLNRIKGLKNKSTPQASKLANGGAEGAKQKSAPQTGGQLSKDDESDKSEDELHESKDNDESSDNHHGKLKKSAARVESVKLPAVTRQQRDKQVNAAATRGRANEDRPVDAKQTRDKSQPASGELVQQQQQQQPARQTKTHNIMMLIDFNPMQQAQQTGARSDVGRLQTSASNPVGGDVGHGRASQKGAGGSGGWRPLETGDTPTSGGEGVALRAGGSQQRGQQRPSSSVAPAVNVQIYNNHLMPQRGSPVNDHSASDYGDEYLSSIDEHEEQDGTGNYAHRLPFASSSAPGHMESLYGDQNGPDHPMANYGMSSDGYDAVAASQQQDFKSLVLPNYTSTPEMAKSSPNSLLVPQLSFSSPPTGGREQRQHHYHGQAVNLAFGDQRQVGATQNGHGTHSSQQTSSETTTEEPILPGESAGTNQLVKQVINELAMSASGHDQQPFASGNSSEKSFYTTTSVHDLASASEDEEDLITSDHFELQHHHHQQQQPQPLSSSEQQQHLQQPLAATSAFELRSRVGQQV